MNPREVIELCHRSGVHVTLDGGGLRLVSLVGSEEVSPGLVTLCRDHKADLLKLLRYEQEADSLILQSTRRLAAVWPFDCALEGPEWEAQEQRLHNAYWSADLDSLKSVLEAREDYALRVFRAYRTEVPNV